MKRKDLQLELNQMRTTIDVFMKAYNQTLPQGFPVATASTLKKFQQQNSSLFSARGGENKKEWSIEKHRKKLMDWLPANTND